MDANAKRHVAAFHGHHSDRTFSSHSQIDPWKRNVLVALQVTLNELASQIDDNTERIERIETFRRNR